MFAGMSFNMIFYFVAGSAAILFFVGYAMNTVLGEQGFGVFGNMIVLLSGYIIGLNLVDMVSSGRVPPVLVLPAAISVAFVALFLLAVLKRSVRMG